jgi:hypothetical protein
MINCRQRFTIEAVKPSPQDAEQRVYNFNEVHSLTSQKWRWSRPSAASMPPGAGIHKPPSKLDWCYRNTGCTSPPNPRLC